MATAHGTSTSARIETHCLKNRSILLIGASCRAAAQSTKRAGVQTVYAWDDFLDADLVEIAQAEPFSSLQVDSIQPELLHGTPLVLCGGMENKPELLESLMDRGVRCGVTGQSIRLLRSLDCWRAWANQCGIGWPETCDSLALGFPNTIQQNTIQQNQKVSDKADMERWLLKPRRGAGGIHVRPMRAPIAIQEAFSEVDDPSDWYLQRYIAGISLGVTYCSDYRATHVVGVAQAIQADEFEAPLPFIYTGNIAPYALSPELERMAQQFGDWVAKQTGIRGLWQADFQLDPQGQLWLLEINPRWSASMELHEILQGFSWIGQHLRILDGHAMMVPEETAVAEDRMGCMIAKGIVYAPKMVHVGAGSLERLWQARWHGERSELENQLFCVADVPHRPQDESSSQQISFSMGEPIATVLCYGRNHPALMEQLRRSKQIVLDWLETS